MKKIIKGMELYKILCRNHAEVSIIFEIDCRFHTFFPLLNNKSITILAKERETHNERI